MLTRTLGTTIASQVSVVSMMGQTGLSNEGIHFQAFEGATHQSLQVLENGGQPAMPRVPQIMNIAYASQPYEDPRKKSLATSSSLVSIGIYQRNQFHKVFEDGAYALFDQYLKKFEPSSLPVPTQNTTEIAKKMVNGVTWDVANLILSGAEIYCLFKMFTTDFFVYGGALWVLTIIEDNIKKVKKPVESASAQEYQKSDEAFEKFMECLQNNSYFRTELRKHIKKNVHNQEIKSLVLDVLKELDDKQAIIETL